MIAESLEEGSILLTALYITWVNMEAECLGFNIFLEMDMVNVNQPVLNFEATRLSINVC